MVRQLLRSQAFLLLIAAVILNGGSTYCVWKTYNTATYYKLCDGIDVNSTNYTGPLCFNAEQCFSIPKSMESLKTRRHTLLTYLVEDREMALVDSKPSRPNPEVRILDGEIKEVKAALDKVTWAIENSKPCPTLELSEIFIYQISMGTVAGLFLIMYLLIASVAQCYEPSKNVALCPIGIGGLLLASSILILVHLQGLYTSSYPCHDVYWNSTAPYECSVLIDVTYQPKHLWIAGLLSVSASLPAIFAGVSSRTSGWFHTTQ